MRLGVAYVAPITLAELAERFLAQSPSPRTNYYVRLRLKRPLEAFGTAQAGVPIATVAREMGHTSTEMTPAARTRRHAMTRYLISFPSDAMAHIPDEEGPEVADAAHAVVQEAKDAGVLVFAGGLDEEVDPVTVAGDATATAGTYPLGGMTIVDVPSRDAALEWATKIATACRCPQDVSAFGVDPAVGN